MSRAASRAGIQRPRRGVVRGVNASQEMEDGDLDDIYVARQLMFS